MSGQVAHFEIPADDPQRANKFYSTTFGWTLVPVPGMDYTMVRTGPVDDQGRETQPGYVGGGIVKRGGHFAHPIVTIVVDDISAAESTIEKNGGKIVQRKMPIGDGSMGSTGYFTDSEGNVIGLYQSPKP